MLHPFISEARGHGLPHPGGASVSIAAHVGVVAIAVALTTPGPITRAVQPLPFERVVYTRPTPLAPGGRATAEHTAAQRQSARAAAAARLSRLLDFSTLTTAAQGVHAAAIAAPAAPAIALESLAPAAGDFAGSDSAVVHAALGAAYARPMSDGAYAEDVVERTAWPKRGNPRPEYPRSLIARHVEARFLVRFVVDSSGRVDRSSIQFPGQIHRLFVEAVRYALLRSRFLPAEIGGMPVPQHVQQLYTFQLVDQ